MAFFLCSTTLVNCIAISIVLLPSGEKKSTLPLKVASILCDALIFSRLEFWNKSIALWQSANYSNLLTGCNLLYTQFFPLTVCCHWCHGVVSPFCATYVYWPVCIFCLHKVSLVLISNIQFSLHLSRHCWFFVLIFVKTDRIFLCCSVVINVFWLKTMLENMAYLKLKWSSHVWEKVYTLHCLLLIWLLYMP